MKKIILLLLLITTGCGAPPPPPQEATPVVPIIKTGSLNNSNLRTKVLVAASTMNTVAMIDVETLAVSAVTVGKDPVSIDVMPDGGKAYIANAASDYVSVISIPSMGVSAVHAGWGPTCVSITPDGKYAVVMNSDNSLSFINTSTDTATIIGTQSKPKGFVVSPDSGSVLVADSGISYLEKIYIPSLTEDTIPIPCPYPSSIAMSDDASVTAVGCMNPMGIVLDHMTDNTIQFIPETFAPSALQFFHNSRYLAAMNVRPGFLFIMNTVSPQDSWYINAGYDSLAFAINSSNTALAIANNSSDDMTFYTISGMSNSGFYESDIPLSAGPIGAVFVDNDNYVVITEGTPMGGASIVNTSDLSVRNVNFIGARGILNR